MRREIAGLGCAILLAGPVSAATIHERTSGAAEREATAITVYNNDLALIKERRRTTLPVGVTRLSLREVSAKLRSETALLIAVTGAPIVLLEQNFDFDLLTPAKLLEKYVGREVTVLRTNPATGDERAERATVLSSNGGTVLRIGNRLESGVPGRLVFDQLPESLRDRPTLSVLLDSNGGERLFELSYLSSGFSWKADYVANLTSNATALDLSGWVTLTNKSGSSFQDVDLQVVAGKVNIVPPSQDNVGQFNRLMKAKAPESAVAEMAQESLLDYHLYRLERPTTIADNQTKQLALLSASAVAATREYQVTASDWYYRDVFGGEAQKIKPAIFLKFQNKGGQLGKPLPAGVVRVYARDSKGAAQFVGEDRIRHTAKNEEVALRLGEAFDVTVERKQTAFRRLTEKNERGERNVGAEVAYRLELRNAKDEPVTVRVRETLPGDWEMLSESHKHQRDSSRVAVWNVAVPADGKSVLEFRLKTRW